MRRSWSESRERKAAALKEQIQRRAERRAEAEENRRFSDRLRFDQGSFWQREKPEPRSLYPSSWTILEAACRKWGVPAGFRPVPQFPISAFTRDKQHWDANERMGRLRAMKS